MRKTMVLGTALMSTLALTGCSSISLPFGLGGHKESIPAAKHTNQANETKDSTAPTGPGARALQNMKQAPKTEERYSMTFSMHFKDPNHTTPSNVMTAINGLNYVINLDQRRLNQNGLIQYMVQGTTTVNDLSTSKSINLTEYATTKDDKTFKVWKLNPQNSAWQTTQATITLNSALRRSLFSSIYLWNLAQFATSNFRNAGNGNFVNHTQLTPNSNDPYLPDLRYLMDTTLNPKDASLIKIGNPKYQLTTTLGNGSHGLVIRDMYLNVTASITDTKNGVNGTFYFHEDIKAAIDPSIEFAKPSKLPPFQTGQGTGGS